jgi:hypothetical protein
LLKQIVSKEDTILKLKEDKEIAMVDIEHIKKKLAHSEKHVNVLMHLTNEQDKPYNWRPT